MPSVVFRLAVADDVDALVDVQREGAVLGLAHIFPQDSHPFPREDVTRRWRAEIADPAVRVYVSTDERGAITGFAAVRADELLHFGTAPATWGSGLAAELHDAVLDALRETSGGVRARLRVFEENRRARRFYEKHGWVPTGGRSRTSFPPHPVLVELVRPLRDPGRTAGTA